MPGFAITLMEKILHVKEMNQVLREHDGKTGVDFAEAVINHLNIKRNVIFVNENSINKDEKYVFISNHPLGGLDGLIITSEITRRFGPAKFIVNELLMAVEPLREIFIPVHNLGKRFVLISFSCFEFSCRSLQPPDRWKDTRFAMEKKFCQTSSRSFEKNSSDIFWRGELQAFLLDF